MSRDELVAVGAAIHILQASAFVEIRHGSRAMALCPAELSLSDDLMLQRCRTRGQLVHANRLDHLSTLAELANAHWWEGMAQKPAGSDPVARAAIGLLKLSGFLPVGILLPLGELPSKPMLSVTTQAVSAYPGARDAALDIACEARVPLRDADDCRFIVYRSGLGGPQHHAIIVGQPQKFGATLCRLHSECFTGDVFGSMRCDCGEQLNGAIRKMRDAGGGVLLYLSQEGRGIGLVNKLRAYRLQDRGVDTVDANTSLGFAPDERNFAGAARMLNLLGIRMVSLLTNNPAKLEGLGNHGIEVAGRVKHSFEANGHNQFYLATKARRSGHLLEIEPTTGRNCHGQAISNG